MIDQLTLRLIIEANQQCKMFWCIPLTDQSNNLLWKVEYFPSDGYDLSNWAIVLHIMKKSWDIDFTICKNNDHALPHGIITDNYIFHGNNLPQSITFSKIASDNDLNLGNTCIPKYDRRFSINCNDLNILEDILGRDLDLDCTNL